MTINSIIHFDSPVGCDLKTHVFYLLLRELKPEITLVAEIIEWLQDDVSEETLKQLKINHQEAIEDSNVSSIEKTRWVQDGYVNDLRATFNLWQSQRAGAFPFSEPKLMTEAL